MTAGAAESSGGMSQVDGSETTVDLVQTVGFPERQFQSDSLLLSRQNFGCAFKESWKNSELKTRSPHLRFPWWGSSMEGGV